MKIMQQVFTVLLLLILAVSFQSCTNKKDDKGRLLTKYITTTSGGLNFTPMMRSDSASVKAFKPDTILFDGKPYTGGLAQYDQHEKIVLEGYLKNGLMDSTWKFYYGSGGVRMEGAYKNGMDIGLWHSYYGYSKPKITKLYDNYGYMLMRIEYFDNGHIKNYQNIKAPMFGDKARNFTNDQHGETITLYVEDSVYVVKQGETAEKVGKNIFQQPNHSQLDLVK